MVLDEKSCQVYPINTGVPRDAGVPRGSIHSSTFSYYTLMTFLMMSSVILLSVLMKLLCTLMWAGIWFVAKLELAPKLESDQYNTADWGGKWLVDFNAGKTQFALFDRSNNCSAIDVKIHECFLRKIIFWDAPKKIGALIRSMKFLTPEVAFFSL